MSNTVAALERILAEKRFTVSKTYDNTKGICYVVAEKKSTNTIIKANNTSRMPLWTAYRRALEFVLDQINQFEKAENREV